MPKAEGVEWGLVCESGAVVCDFLDQCFEGCGEVKTRLIGGVSRVLLILGIHDMNILDDMQCAVVAGVPLHT
jgi:hypothetical protein